MEDQTLIERLKNLPFARVLVFLIASGLLFIALGIKLMLTPSEPSIEFIEQNQPVSTQLTLVSADVQGAVESPGLYELPGGSRIQELLLKAGGLSPAADREWVAKYINLATKVIDGTKLYIPRKGETLAVNVSSSEERDMVSLNMASRQALMGLPGIGEVTADKIITNRPYQTIDELLTRKIVGQNTFDKIKTRINL